jgi:hypothetical protein
MLHDLAEILGCAVEELPVVFRAARLARREQRT